MNDSKHMGNESEKHELHLKSRRQMSVDGVKDIIGFDETTVQMITACGDMTVEGSGLHIGVLDVEKGIVCLEGEIESIYYSDSDNIEKRSFWSRLVK